MKNNLLYLLILFITTGSNLFSQNNKSVLPGNDDPCNAYDLGLMDIPPLCPQVNANADTLVTGFTTGSTALSTGNPHPFSCSFFQTAHDVWFKFKASSERVTINVYGTGITPIITPAFALYQPDNGNCQNLLPMGCASGSTAAIRTFESLIPGEEYYIQVAAAFPSVDGDFSMKIYSKRTCDECTQDAELYFFPPPTNGGYPPNTTVHMVAEISGFSAFNNGGARLHGIYPTFGPGWDATSLVAVSTEAPVSVDGNGTWIWNNILTNDGYYYDDGDGIPNNNLGDQNTQFGSSWTAGWTIKTNTNCNATQSLSVDLNTSTDAQTGSNPNTGSCGGDTAVSYDFWPNCCGIVILNSVTNETCGGVSNNGAVSISVGFAPYDYYLYDENGNQIDNSSSSTNTSINNNNLTQGNYSAWFYNINNNCWTTLNFTIGGNISVIAYQDVFGCINNYGSGGAYVSIIPVTNGAYIYSWYNIDGNLVSSSSLTTLLFDTIGGLVDGDCYYVKVTDLNGCVGISDDFCVSLTPADLSTMAYTSSFCIATGTAISPNSQVNGDVFSFNSTPNGSVATIDVNTGMFTPDVEGFYYIQYTSSTTSLCPAVFEDTVAVAFQPPALIVNGQAAFQVCEQTTTMPQFEIVNNPNYSPIWLDAFLIPTGNFGNTFTPPVPPGTGNYTYYAAYYSSINASCVSLTQFSLNVLPAPAAELGSDITICQGDTANLTAVTDNNTNTFYWQPYDPSYLQTQTGNGSNKAYPTTDMTLYVIISTLNSPYCQTTDSVHIIVNNGLDCELNAYNGFTPNGDGKNDSWYIEGIEQLTNTTVSVFNRWGDRVWETNSYNNTSNAWRGNDTSGNTVPDGTYYYVIISNGRVTQNWIELTR